VFLAGIHKAIVFFPLLIYAFYKGGFYEKGAWHYCGDKGVFFMKNWKQSGLIGMVAIIALGFAFIGCDDGNGKTGKKTPVVDDFTISGTGIFDYDGTAKTVSITPKPNKSTGVITVYYDGSLTAPVGINIYTVTFDVAGTEGFNLANGLSAGTLEIESPIIKMVWIEAGTFTMGSPADEPGRNTTAGRETQHPVTLTAGFYMGKYPVTQAQYEAVMGSNPSYHTTPVSPETDTGKRPVEMVSWYDALVFCNKLSIREGLTPAYKIDGKTDPAEWGTVPTTGNSDATWNAVEIVAGSNGYRLPTEAQWEYACRAGTTTAFSWGTNIVSSTQANYDGSTVDANNTTAGTNLERTSMVGSYAANAWGLYDMHGNVFEWCWDQYGTYEDGPQTDPTGAVSGSNRVIRGGARNGSGQNLRSAFRGDAPPGLRGGIFGFRLVRP
jgi:formylglycine-generating enzyme required for sulfatase activity